MIVNVPHLRPKLLFHGAPETRFPVIYPGDKPTCAGDPPGCTGYPHGFVFASHNYFHAAAYGFMRYAFVVGGFYVSENSEHGFIPTIVLVPRADSPDSDVFSKVSQQTCYLHTLSSCDFEGVYSEKGFLQNRLPQEWVKGKNAAVINVTAIPNDDFVKKGFQVYSVNPDAVRQRTGLDERRFIQKLQLRYSEKALDQIQFIDGKTAQEIVNHSHDPSPLAKLCQAGILKLENLRPEYDGVPGARPPVLLRMMGAKTYECFRQTRPLSALQP